MNENNKHHLIAEEDYEEDLFDILQRNRQIRTNYWHKKFTEESNQFKQMIAEMRDVDLVAPVKI